MERSYPTLPESPDDNPRMDSFLNERFALFEKLPGEDDDAGCTVTHLSILRGEKHTIRNVHRWAQSAMDRWIDTDSIDRYFWPHFHRCYRSIG